MKKILLITLLINLTVANASDPTEKEIVEFARDFAAKSLSYAEIRESIGTDTVVEVQVANKYCHVHVQKTDGNMIISYLKCQSEKPTKSLVR
jgi:hypothetical protein